MQPTRKTCFPVFFLFATLIFSLVTHAYGKETPKDKTSAKVVVYYFHGDVRCHTCKKIEKLTTEAVHTYFEDLIQNGTLALKIINVDQNANQHFSKHYKLYTRSVIVSDISSGSENRWKNLQRVWELVHDDKAFQEYVRKEINDYLK